MSLSFLLFFLLTSVFLSLLAAYIVLRRIGRFLNRQYIYFGMAIFFIGIGLHGLIAFPVVVYRHGLGAFLGVLRSRVSRWDTFHWGEIIYFAIAAGVGQELAKALPILFELRRTDGKSPNPPFFWLGINIGLGFSLSEIIFIGITEWQPHMGNMVKLAFPNTTLLCMMFRGVGMASFERLGATLFHMATAGLIAFGFERGRLKLFLLISIVLHATVDAFVGIAHKLSIFPDVPEELILFSFSFSLLIIILLLNRHHNRPFFLKKPLKKI